MNAIELLKKDHQIVENLFRLCEVAESAEQKRHIFQKIRAELETHTEIEEVVLYPFFQDKPGFKDMITEALDEHMEAKSVLETITRSTTDNEMDNKLDELIEAVRHHVKEEENELFPKIQKTLSNDELDALGRKLQDAKHARQQRTAA